MKTVTEIRLYNAQIVEDKRAKAELKKEAINHLSRHGGILQSFNEAIEK
jgi:hypothetical protein